MLFNTLGDKPVVKWFSALSIWKETTGLVLVWFGFTGLPLALLHLKLKSVDCCEVNLFHLFFYHCQRLKVNEISS